MRLAGVDVTALADDQWIEATGQVRPGTGTKADGYVPTLDATSVRVVDQPADPYEY